MNVIPQPPVGAPPAASTTRRHNRLRSPTWMAAMLMAGMSLVIGLGVSVYDGAMNELFWARVFFVLVGLFAFYIPGLLMAAAAIGLQRGWVRMVRLGIVAAAAQGVMAFVASFGQFAFTEFSVLHLVEGLLWTAADFCVAVLLWRALPWVAADAGSRHGFEVTALEAESADVEEPGVATAPPAAGREASV